MLPPSLSPNELLSRTSNPRAEHVSFALECFSSLVHAICVDHSNARSMWSELRCQFDASGYWPLIASYITNGPPGPWKEVVLNESGQLFSRFSFQEEVDARLPGMRSAEPEDIVEASRSSDPLREIMRFQERQGGTAAEHAMWICDALQRAFGAAPEPQQLLRALSAQSKSPWADLQRLAFDWLETRGPGLSKMHDPYWHEPVDPLAILLLPIGASCEALAYIHWWGCHTIGTPSVIRLMRGWEERYGAELMCHYGTVLHLNVAAPISSASEAFEVASEIETICMESGFIESAADLLGATHWHLHNRP